MQNVCKLDCSALQNREILLFIITCDADVTKGADWLAAQDPKWEAAIAACGPLPLRLRPDGFAQLLSAIVSQQVSTASAAAIWARMEAAKLSEAVQIRAATDADLRDVGLSRQKMRYARALADADIDFSALRELPPGEVIKTLTQVPGIGSWTAEIYAMFSLGHADVFAPGDLALQEAARHLFELPDRPREKELRTLAEAWSPWRSVAARVLWAYYRYVNNREGIR